MADSTTPKLNLTLPEDRGGSASWGAKLNANFTAIDTAVDYLKTKNNYVNVKDYGAVGDGSTDDTAAFVAALATGKSVFVPGTTAYYKLTTTPTISTANQRIFGEGHLSKIVQTGTTTNSTVLTVNATNGVVIENLYLVPNSTVSSQLYGWGVFVQSSSKVTVRNCLITGHLTGAIGLFMSDHCVISGCVARDSAFVAPNIATMGVDFFVVYGGNYNTFTGNKSINGGVGFAVQTLTGGGTGNGNVFANNTVKNAAGYGFMLYVGDPANSALKIQHNTISNNNIDGVTGNVNHTTDGYVYGTGIYIQAAEYTDIIGNTIYDTCGGTLIDQLAPAAIGTTNCAVVNITGNTIRKTGAWCGISVRDPNSTGTTTGFANVTGNNIYDTRWGVQIYDRGRVNVSGNVIDTCTAIGVQVTIPTALAKPLISITNNTMRNVVTGVTASYVSDLKIAGNSIQLWGAGGNYAISISDSSHLTLQNNSCTSPSSGAYGINIAATVSSGFVTGNYVTGCSSGIRMILSADLRTIGNRITSNATNYYGTYAANATTDDQISYLATLSENVQDQINRKAPHTNPVFTGTVTTQVTHNRAVTTDNSGTLTGAATTATEIDYLSGTTSNVQTQLNAKAPTASPTFTGTITTPVTGNKAVTTNASGALTASGTTDTELGYVSGVTSAIQSQLNAKAPTASPTFTGSITTPLTGNKAVTTNVSGALTASATSDTELGYLSGVSSNVQTQLSAKAPTASPTFTGTVTTPVTGNKALTTNASGALTASTTTDTELGYVAGVTSAIQTQLNAKAPAASPTFTGTITTPVTANKALVTSGTGALTASATTDTQIGYLSGVTSDVQTQLNAKAPTASPTFTGTVTTPLTGNKVVTTSVAGALAASATSDTELGYVAGVTSAIQTQLNAKAPAASPTFTGTVTTPVTASRALTTNASSALTASATTDTELGYLSGVTSAVQTQINTKAADSAVVHNTGTETVAGAKTFSSAPVLAPGASDDTQYTVLRATAQQGTAVTHYEYTTTGVTTSAKTIWALNQYCELVMVTGTDGAGNIFGDVICVAYAKTTVNTISSLNSSGSPAARTYSVSTGNLQLTMASGTYRICSYGISLRPR